MIKINLVILNILKQKIKNIQINLALNLRMKIKLK